MDQRKTRRVVALFTPDDYEALKQASEKDRTSVSTFVVGAVLRRLRRPFRTSPEPVEE